MKGFKIPLPERNAGPFFSMILHLFICFPAVQTLSAQRLQTCTAVLNKDTLTIGNSLISRRFLWNRGDLITLAVEDKKNSSLWNWTSKSPDVTIPGHPAPSDEGWLDTLYIKNDPVHEDCLEVTVTARLQSLFLKRIFRIYPDIPVLGCRFLMKGKAPDQWHSQLYTRNNPASEKGIESAGELNATHEGVPVMDNLCFEGNHWQLNTVEFFDMTDRNNNLVRESRFNLYRLPGALKGNLLFIRDLQTDYSFFVLKEAPCSDMQLANPGFDFLVKNGSIQTAGMGIDPADLSDSSWTSGYGYVFGLAGKTELQKLQALRSWQDVNHIRRADRDDEFVMNTWGDRNKDAKISEKFILEELTKAARLGITHYQIDDGWQAGRSINSSLPGGVFKEIYKDNKYWTPNPSRFPNGFDPILARAKKLNIKIGLWFSPSSDSNYKYWLTDAQTIIGLYRSYDICFFKIDFVQIENKTSEVNFRHFLETVQKQTDYKVSFNLDVTAGRRNGYHFFNEFGSLYVENRYTDWTNYYPYWTLRNLWDLSRYVPPQNLQIEFLNKWRNVDRYPVNDPFAPAVYSFDYLFATACMAEPLAFFEATGLPEEGFETAKWIHKFLSFRDRIHRGQVFPIGEEPDGRSWTGFQSLLNERQGFILVFREDNHQSAFPLQTFLTPGKIIKCSLIGGSGKSFEGRVSAEGKLVFDLTHINSFALYQYAVQ